VKLLLDSHVLLWWLDGAERLSRESEAAIRRGASDVAVSVVSLWELSIKQSLGKLRVDGDLLEHMAQQTFTELPVLGVHAVAVRDLPLHHRDPFDRLLIAQARCERFTLVTSDRAMTAYDVPIMPA
jgi:PIN domain nuclease of toxin-antitoxin system